MSKSKVRGKRDFLGDIVPLLVGRNPVRVAPAHIMNGFAVSAIGTGKMSGPVRALVRRYENDDALTSVSGAIMGSQEKRRRFGEALRVVLDPDRRVFPHSGSFFPLHAGLIDENRGMDDGFGRDVWRLVATYSQEATSIVRNLLIPSDAADGLTALGVALGADDGAPPQRRTVDPWPWHERGGQSLAHRFGKALCGLVLNPITSNQAAIRSIRLAALSRAVGTAAFLGALRAPEFAANRARAWSDLSPLFAFGGVPPGAVRSLPIRLACRSFEAVVERQRDSLLALLTKRLSNARIPRQTPRSQHPTAIFAAAFPEVSKSLRGSAVDEVRWDADRDKLAANFLRKLYPPGYLAGAYRTIGRMIGLSGPERGAGAPRFVLETPVLALLVSASIDDEQPLPYRAWLDQVYDRFGIILGLGETLDAPTLLRPLGFGGSLLRALEENHETLRRRLVRCGLASEYSDGETEVHGPFVLGGAT